MEGEVIPQETSQKERQKNRHRYSRIALLFLELMSYATHLGSAVRPSSVEKNFTALGKPGEENPYVISLPRAPFEEFKGFQEIKVEKSEMETWSRILEEFFLKPPKPKGNVYVFSSAEHHTPYHSGWSIYDDFQRGMAEGYLDFDSGKIQKFPIDEIEGEKLVRIVDTQGRAARLGWLNFAITPSPDWKFDPYSMGRFIVEVDGKRVIDANIGEIIDGKAYPGLKKNGLVVSHNDREEGGGFALYLPLEGRDIKVWLERPNWFDIPVYLDENIEGDNIISFSSIAEREHPVGKEIRQFIEAPWRKIELLGKPDINKQIIASEGWRLEEDGVLQGFRLKFNSLDELLDFVENSELEINYSNKFTTHIPFQAIYGKRDALEKGRKDWRIIAHGIHKTKSGKYILYFNLPIELKKGESIRIKTEKEGINVETLFMKAAIGGKRQFLMIDKFTTDTENKGFIIEPSLFLQSGKVVAILTDISYKVRKGVKEGEVLRWTMPPLEGGVLVGILSPREGYINSGITGYEETIPGAGFHFISRGKFGKSYPMSGQTPFGGVIYYQKEKQGEKIDPLQRIRTILQDSATLITIPPHFEAKDILVVYMPFLPTFDPNLKKFDVKAESYVLYYTSNPIDKNLSIETLQNLYKVLIKTFGEDVETVYKLWEVYINHPELLKDISTYTADVDSFVDGNIARILKLWGFEENEINEYLNNLSAKDKGYILTSSLPKIDKIESLRNDRGFREWFGRLRKEDKLDLTLFLARSLDVLENLQEIGWDKVPTDKARFARFLVIIEYALELPDNQLKNKIFELLQKGNLKEADNIATASHALIETKNWDLILEIRETDRLSFLRLFGKLVLGSEEGVEAFIKAGKLWRKLNKGTWNDFLYYVSLRVLPLPQEYEIDYKWRVMEFLKAYPVAISIEENGLGRAEEILSSEFFSPNPDWEQNLEKIKRFIERGKDREVRRRIVRNVFALVSKNTKSLYDLRRVWLFSTEMYLMYGSNYKEFFKKLEAEENSDIISDIATWIIWTRAGSKYGIHDPKKKRMLLESTLREFDFSKSNLLTELSYKTLLHFYPYPWSEYVLDKIYKKQPEVLETYYKELFNILNFAMTEITGPLAMKILLKALENNVYLGTLVPYLVNRVSDNSVDYLVELELDVLYYLKIDAGRPDILFSLGEGDREDFFNFLLEEMQSRPMTESEAIVWVKIYGMLTSRSFSKEEAKKEIELMMRSRRILIEMFGGNPVVVDNLFLSLGDFAPDDNEFGLRVKALKQISSGNKEVREKALRTMYKVYKKYYEEVLKKEVKLGEYTWMRVMKLLLASPNHENAKVLHEILGIEVPKGLDNEKILEFYIYLQAAAQTGFDSLYPWGRAMRLRELSELIQWSYGDDSVDNWAISFARKECKGNLGCLEKRKENFRNALQEYLSRSDFSDLDLSGVESIYWEWNIYILGVE